MLPCFQAAPFPAFAPDVQKLVLKSTVPDFYSLEANLVILIFNERALDLRNYRRYRLFFGLFPRARGGASSLPRGSLRPMQRIGRFPTRG